MTDLPSIALSVRQPWAWAIIHAGKDIENRSAIHAAKGLARCEYEDAAEFMRKIGIECPLPALLQRGGIIGAVDVIDIVKEHQSLWFFGPRGLVLANATACDLIPSGGALGYFRWQRNDAVKVEYPKWMSAAPPGQERMFG